MGINSIKQLPPLVSSLQTQTTVSVSFSLKGVHPSKIDVFAAPDYVKVNFAPFLFEAFLAGEVIAGDDEDEEKRGRQLFDAGRIILQLKKTTEGIWSDGPCRKNLRLLSKPTSTEISFIMRSRFGEVCSCCS